MIEQEILNRLAEAKIRLRNDKVVRELVGDLQAALADFVPDGQALLFTCTAPVRQSGKTAKEVERRVREGFSGKAEIHGNQILVRRVTGLPDRRPRVLGFVHNPGLDAGLILDMAEASLASSSRS